MLNAYIKEVNVYKMLQSKREPDPPCRHSHCHYTPGVLGFNIANVQ